MKLACPRPPLAPMGGPLAGPALGGRAALARPNTSNVTSPAAPHSSPNRLAPLALPLARLPARPPARSGTLTKRARRRLNLQPGRLALERLAALLIDCQARPLGRCKRPRHKQSGGGARLPQSQVLLALGRMAPALSLSSLQTMRPASRARPGGGGNGRRHGCNSSGALIGARERRAEAKWRRRRRRCRRRRRARDRPLRRPSKHSAASGPHRPPCPHSSIGKVAPALHRSPATGGQSRAVRPLRQSSPRSHRRSGGGWTGRKSRPLAGECIDTLRHARAQLGSARLNSAQLNSARPRSVPFPPAAGQPPNWPRRAS